MDFSAVTPAIILAVYVIVELLKMSILKDSKKKALIPLCCIVIGAFIGWVIYIFYPQGIEADNAIGALATGGLSGLAATGCNQLWKQYQKYSGGIDEDNEYQNSTSITVNLSTGTTDGSSTTSTTTTTYANEGSGEDEEPMG